VSSQASAVIFDMDGLLVDSEPLWRRAEQAIFPKVGVQLTDAMCMETMGTRVDEVVRHWYTVKPWSGPTLEQVEEEIVSSVVALVRAEGEPMPGVRQILDLLARQQCRLALASSSSMRLIDAVVDKLGIRHCFEVLKSAEHEAYGKPHPGVFLSTAAELDVDPTRCLVFEDSFAGLIAALAARMKVVVVPDPAHFEQPRFHAAHLKLRELGAFDERSLHSLMTEMTP
jgi:mannitol-1-/sugar-/sorbitol-6-/2-deoxyglucose-6-phosphatase